MVDLFTELFYAAHKAVNLLECNLPFGANAKDFVNDDNRITNQNSIHGEIKSRLNSGNACLIQS
jgi:hypothetical protein